MVLRAARKKQLHSLYCRDNTDCSKQLSAGYSSNILSLWCAAMLQLLSTSSNFCRSMLSAITLAIFSAVADVFLYIQPVSPCFWVFCFQAKMQYVETPLSMLESLFCGTITTGSDVGVATEASWYKIKIRYYIVWPTGSWYAAGLS